MEHLSVRLTSLSSSATLAMSQKSNELKAQGVDVINLSVGEPDFFTPDPIKAAAKKAIDNNFSFYSPVPGFLDLRKAIVAKLKRENGLDYTVDQIIVSNGAKQSICNTLLCLVDPGDEVIVPAPYWVSYVEMVKLAEGTNVILPAGIDQNFKITPEQLEAAITPKTKALILCTPSNPTGSVYSHDELEALLREAGIQAEWHDDIQLQVWKKFIIISVSASVTSYFDLPVLLALERHPDMCHRLLQEATSVAQARGFDLTEEYCWQELLRTWGSDEKSTTSMHRDFRAGRPTEVDSLCGYIVREAERLNISVPAYEEIYRGLKVGICK